MKDKFALYDYCETLIDSQTANEFAFQYTLERLGVVKKIQAVLFSKLRVFKKNRKWLLLGLLKGQTKEDIESFSTYFAEGWLLEHHNDKLMDDLNEKKSKGYKIIIISAGFGSYIEAHNRFVGADKIIANEFSYVDGLFSGLICGADCHGAEKVRRLESSVGLGKIDLKNSYFYSDCLSDLPLFEIFGNTYFVKDGDFERIDV